MCAFSAALHPLGLQSLSACRSPRAAALAKRPPNAGDATDVRQPDSGGLYHTDPLPRPSQPANLRACEAASPPARRAWPQRAAAASRGVARRLRHPQPTGDSGGQHTSDVAREPKNRAGTKSTSSLELLRGANGATIAPLVQTAARPRKTRKDDFRGKACGCCGPHDRVVGEACVSCGGACLRKKVTGGAAAPHLLATPPTNSAHHHRQG